MGLAYVYHEVCSLAVFVAFEVLNDEDKTPEGERQWIRRKDERGYFNNTVEELAVKNTAES